MGWAKLHRDLRFVWLHLPRRSFRKLVTLVYGPRGAFTPDAVEVVIWWVLPQSKWRERSRDRIGVVHGSLDDLGHKEDLPGFNDDIC